MQTQPTETLGQIVNRIMREKKLKIADLVKGARMSQLTLYAIKGDKIPSLRCEISNRKKRAWVRVVARLAHFLEQDPTEWLKLVGIHPDEEWIREVITNNGQIGSEFNELAVTSMQMGRYPLNIADMEFLLSVQKLMQEPMTFGLAYELIRRRSPKQESEVPD